MLAKYYNFPYEAITAYETVQKDVRRKPTPLVCQKGVSYPLYNAESVVNALHSLKEEIRLLIEDEGVVYSKKQFDEALITHIRYIMEEKLKTIQLRIITETGYKESFVYHVEGEFCFDLGSIKKVCKNNEKKLNPQYLIIKDETINLATIHKELWCSRWSMVKNSL